MDERADGVYVRIPALAPRSRTVGDVLVETLVAFGITHVFGMVGHSNLASPMPCGEPRSAGS